MSNIIGWWLAPALFTLFLAGRILLLPPARLAEGRALRFSIALNLSLSVWLIWSLLS